ncbi:HPr kinase/phosphatase C-terminal domain-containing protein [Hoeflea alexandrii]|uniref:HPr kinase/phosphorylase n=1 Tax=Hoeflea alexandrii TaxID=288436 RepID=UPI0035D10B59
MTGISVPAGEAVHATAIVVGQTGLLFLGPSGSGKSTTAFACLCEAQALGWNAALIADDRTLLTVQAGRCIASCPDSIRGLLELRGTGVVTARHVDRAVLHAAVLLTEPSAGTRVPEENETFSCGGASIPLMRLWHDGAALPLARLRTRRPSLFFEPAWYPQGNLPVF